MLSHFPLLNVISSDWRCRKFCYTYVTVMLVIDHKIAKLFVIKEGQFSLCIIYHKPFSYCNVGMFCDELWKRMPLRWLFVINQWSL